MYGDDKNGKSYGLMFGDDKLVGGLGNDNIYGGQGDDFLQGDEGNDSL